MLATAKEMEDMPPGRADFFKALQEKMSVMDIDGKYTFPEGTSEYLAAERRYANCRAVLNFTD